MDLEHLQLAEMMSLHQTVEAVALIWPDPITLITWTVFGSYRDPARANSNGNSILLMLKIQGHVHMIGYLLTWEPTVLPVVFVTGIELQRNRVEPSYKFSKTYSTFDKDLGSKLWDCQTICWVKIRLSIWI